MNKNVGNFFPQMHKAVDRSEQIHSQSLSIRLLPQRLELLSSATPLSNSGLSYLLSLYLSLFGPLLSYFLTIWLSMLVTRVK